MLCLFLVLFIFFFNALGTIIFLGVIIFTLLNIARLRAYIGLEFYCVLLLFIYIFILFHYRFSALRKLKRAFKYFVMRAQNQSNNLRTWFRALRKLKLRALGVIFSILIPDLVLWVLIGDWLNGVLYYLWFQFILILVFFHYLVVYLFDDSL